MPKFLKTPADCKTASAFLALVILIVGVSGCRTAPSTVLLAAENSYLSVAQAASLEGIKRVGFDVDDTLLFSTGAFRKGFDSGHRYDSEEFWALVNTSDSGNSIVKESARAVVETYQKRGIELFAITARSPVGGVELARYLHGVFGIPKENIFFEPDSKTARIRELRLDVFFGDSDSDITDAMEAGVRAIRFQRSENSSYKNEDGSLRKYHPGLYGEQIVNGSKY